MPGAAIIKTVTSSSSEFLIQFDLSEGVQVIGRFCRQTASSGN
jgi:hypothetical protein